eukprot:8270198-Pyramimonas_sp.AAC.1
MQRKDFIVLEEFPQQIDCDFGRRNSSFSIEQLSPDRVPCTSERACRRIGPRARGFPSIGNRPSRLSLNTVGRRENHDGTHTYGNLRDQKHDNNRQLVGQQSR